MKKPQRSYQYEERCDQTEQREKEHYDEAMRDIASFLERVRRRERAEEKLVNQSQMAEVLGCTPKTVANLVRRGKIPSIKVGDLRRYQPHLVIAALTVEAEEEIKGKEYVGKSRIPRRPEGGKSEHDK